MECFQGGTDPTVHPVQGHGGLGSIPACSGREREIKVVNAADRWDTGAARTQIHMEWICVESLSTIFACTSL